MTDAKTEQATFPPQQDPYLPLGYTVRSDNDSSSSEDPSQSGHEAEDYTNEPKLFAKRSFMHRLKTRVLMRPGHNRGKNEASVKGTDKKPINSEDIGHQDHYANTEAKGVTKSLPISNARKFEKLNPEKIPNSARIESNIRQLLKENGNKHIELLNLIKEEEVEDKSEDGFDSGSHDVQTDDYEQSSGDVDGDSLQFGNKVRFLDVVNEGKPRVSTTRLVDNQENIDEFGPQERTSSRLNYNDSENNTTINHTNNNIEMKSDDNVYKTFAKVFKFLNREFSPQISLDSIAGYILETLMCFSEREELLNCQRNKLTQTLQESRKKFQAMEQEYKHKLDQCGEKLCKLTSELNASKESMSRMSGEVANLKKKLGFYQKLLEKMGVSFDQERNPEDQFKQAVISYEQASKKNEEQKLLNKKLETLAGRWKLSTKRLAEENKGQTETIKELRTQITSLGSENEALREEVSSSLCDLQSIRDKYEKQNETIRDLREKYTQSQKTLEEKREKVHNLRKTTEELDHNLQLHECFRIYSLEFMSELMLSFENCLSSEVVEEARRYMLLLSSTRLLPPSIGDNTYNTHLNIENERRSLENNIRVFFTELATQGVLNPIIDEYRQCIQGNYLYFKRLQEFKQRCARQTEIIARLNEHLKAHSRCCSDSRRERIMRSDVHAS